MAFKTLDDKFVYELGGIYDSEHQFLEAQQHMVQHAGNDQVKSLLETHIKQTEEQIRNLEQVFKALGQEPNRVKCGAASGLISDGQKLIKEAGRNPQIIDAAIAGAQSKIEHFEMACYRGLVTGAEVMGNQELLKLLQQNLQQEEQTAQKIEQSLPQLLREAMGAQERER